MVLASDIYNGKMTYRIRANRSAFGGIFPLFV